MKEAERGCPDSMGILGWRYQEGFGVEKDLDKAKHYFKMEKNAEPFKLDNDEEANPWMKPTVDV